MSTPHSLTGWLEHLERLHPRGQAGIELGLDRVRRVRDALGQRENVPVVTVGGTNGKGSTCAYLETILDRAGYRVGGYSSPHLIAYNERVRVGLQAVGDTELCAAFTRVEAARRSAGPGGTELPLTYFEFSTLAAWEVFAAAGVEVVLLEVGLGGRLDAVNAYEPDVAIVTGIALDHMDYLGPTREHIGREKAGIFRAGKPALCADPEPPQSLLAHAAAIGADLRLLGRDFGYLRQAEERAQWQFWTQREGRVQRRVLAYPGLRGNVQLRNAAVAMAALDCLQPRLPVAMQAIRRGLIETELAGRFQVIPGRPTTVLDVAHNPQAAEVLRDNLGGMGFYDTTVGIVGMLGDKDVAGTLAPLLGRVDHWLAVPLDSPRAASPERLVECLHDLGAVSVDSCGSVAEALDRAAKRAGEAGRIAAFGSFLTVAAALVALGRGA